MFYKFDLVFPYKQYPFCVPFTSFAQTFAKQKWEIKAKQTIAEKRYLYR